ncbi:hypothetical protein DFR29_12821 [Tahibacter aquaticus]|uniref:HEPN domain-containing protein n=1 Tax=Tahibacter aquaticus TaxID=520092 RepID=A0A4V3DKX9_9GAMM|nr:hypothetical protein [Tahibacter aquaticus]TDR36600.1 hypothetical protein DFR29_12821 [Tahibacter aquaticus]
MSTTPSFDLPASKSLSDYSGQKLFIEGEDWHNTAMLGWTPYPLDLYAAGYKDAANALVEALTERRAALDSVIYPLVFLYRQGIELELKLILPLARRVAEQPTAKDHRHGLMSLWKELRTLVEGLDTDASDLEMPVVEEFIRQLDEVDPGSFAFRYPTDKKGEVSLPGLERINVRHLSEIMDTVFSYLGGTYSWLGEMEQAIGDY